jgi:hypothetical protein
MNKTVKKSNLVEITIIVLFLFGVFLSCDTTKSEKISPISSVPEPFNPDSGSPPLPEINNVKTAIIKLKDKNPNVRYDAAIALSIIKDKQAVEPLISALKDREPSVQFHAVVALGAIRDVRAVEPLITTLKDEDADFRKESARALGKIRDIRAVEPLLTALKDKDPKVRIEAAYSLVAIRDARAVEPLMEALKDEKLEIVAGAYRFYIHLGISGSENVLIRSLNKYGSMVPFMAEDFLNCGNNQLEEAAAKWAKYFNYMIVPTAHYGKLGSGGLHRAIRNKTYFF